MIKTISVTEARRKFGWLIKEVSKGQDYVVTQKGKPLAVLISIEKYQQRQEQEKEVEADRDIAEGHVLGPVNNIKEALKVLKKSKI